MGFENVEPIHVDRSASDTYYADLKRGVQDRRDGKEPHVDATRANSGYERGYKMNQN